MAKLAPSLASPDTAKQVKAAFYRPAYAGTAQLQLARAIHGAERHTYERGRAEREVMDNEFEGKPSEERVVKHRRRYFLKERYIFSKFLMGVVSVSLLLLYLPASLYLSLQVLALNKIDLPQLFENSSFVGIFSSVLGAIIGIVGIIYQLRKSRVTEQMRYQLEKIHVPLYQAIKPINERVARGNYRHIKTEVSAAVSEVDREFRLSKLESFYLDSLFEAEIDCILPRMELDNKFFELQFAMIPEGQSVVVNMTVPTDRVRRLLEGDRIIFEYVNADGSPTENLKYNTDLLLRIKKTEEYRKFLSAHNNIAALLRSLTAYLKYQISKKKEKVY